MLQNARVTVCTVSDLLWENQQGGKVTAPFTQIRVKNSFSGQELRTNQKTKNDCFIINKQYIEKTKKKKTPETIKEDLLRSIIKTADRDDSVLKEAVRNVKKTQ